MHSLQEEMLRLRDQLAATERKLERYESESLAQQLAPPASSSANAATTPVASTFQPSASVVRIPSVSSETGANASASPTPSTARYVMEPSAVASTTGREQVASASKQDNGHTIHWFSGRAQATTQATPKPTPARTTTAAEAAAAAATTPVLYTRSPIVGRAFARLEASSDNVVVRVSDAAMSPALRSMAWLPRGASTRSTGAPPMEPRAVPPMATPPPTRPQHQHHQHHHAVHDVAAGATPSDSPAPRPSPVDGLTPASKPMVPRKVHLDVSSATTTNDASVSLSFALPAHMQLPGAKSIMSMAAPSSNSPWQQQQQHAQLQPSIAIIGPNH